MKWAESPGKPSRAGLGNSHRVAGKMIGRPKVVEIIEDPDFAGAFLIEKAKKC
jgi:hypothetical protein